MLDRAALSLDTSIPLFERVANELRKLITAGIIGDGKAMPPVRAVVKELQVAAQTVQAAYDVLERQGYLRVVKRRGYFAVTDPEWARYRRRADILGELFEARERLRRRGYTDYEIRACLKEFNRTLSGDEDEE